MLDSGPHIIGMAKLYGAGVRYNRRLYSRHVNRFSYTSQRGHNIYSIEAGSINASNK
jgi:hypothetical protein